MSVPFSSVLASLFEKCQAFLQKKINCETLLNLQTKYFNLWVATEESRQIADFYAPHHLYLKTISHTKEKKPRWPDFHPFTNLFDGCNTYSFSYSDFCSM